MSKIALAIIDGTGDYNDADYAKEMARSFCNQLSYKFPGAARYERGPSLEGYRIRERGQRAADFLNKQQAAGAKQLFIAGYSRGGSAAVFAADILGKAKIAVDGMFLFDPVARHFTPGGEGIPANVRYSRTALRSRDPALIAKYEPLINPCNPMRPSFGNIDLTPVGGGIHEQMTFRGSHGALGGVGSKEVTEDPACQMAVANYMNVGFARFGIDVGLASFAA